MCAVCTVGFAFFAQCDSSRVVPRHGHGMQQEQTTCTRVTYHTQRTTHMQRTLNPILSHYRLDCRNNTLLVYLDLSRNGIGDKCASDIFQARLPAPVRSTQTYSQRGRPLHGVKAPGDRPDDMCRVCIRFAVEPCLPSGPDACQPASPRALLADMSVWPSASSYVTRVTGVARRGGAWRGAAAVGLACNRPLLAHAL
jgi:hypothetical protein